VGIRVRGWLRRAYIGKWEPMRGEQYMRESQLEEQLKRAEEVYDGLVQTQRSLGTMLTEVIRKGGDLDEFERHLRELPHLCWQADLRRTELRLELLDLRAKRAEEEYRRAGKEASKAARSLEQARKAYVEADEAARRSGLEARQLAELRDKEARHLQELYRVQEEAKRQRSQDEGQGEQERQRKVQEEIQGEIEGAQEERQGE
jgi:hypothetical protein